MTGNATAERSIARATGLFDQYLGSRDTAALAAAVKEWRAALAATSSGDPRRPGVLNNLVIALCHVHEWGGAPSVLAEIHQLQDELLALAPATDLGSALMLSNNAAVLVRLYDGTGDPKALEQAVETGRLVAAALPADDPNRATVLNNLGIALRRYGQLTGDRLVPAEAVAAIREAVRLTPPGHGKRPMYLTNLAVVLQVLFERSAETSLIGEAVDAARSAVAATPDGDPHRATRMVNLAGALRSHADVTGDLESLAEAIAVNREAVPIVPAGRRRLDILSGLRLLLDRLFERTGDDAALAEAVRIAREVVAADPADSDSSLALVDLLTIQFGRTGKRATLAEAIRIQRAAVAACPPGHPDRPRRLGNLASTLNESYQWTGDLQSVIEAVGLARDTVATLGDDDPDQAGARTNLGLTLIQLAERTGESATFDEAVEACRQAVVRTPAGADGRAGRLTNLSQVLLRTFLHRGDLALLTEAERVGRDAVDAAPPGHPDRLRVLRNFGTLMQQLFQRTNDVEVILEAARNAHELVTATRATAMSQLGSSLTVLTEVLLMQYQRYPAGPVLSEALVTAREAVAVTPPGFRDRARVLNNHGGVLLLLFRQPGEMAALDDAVRLLRQAVAAVPDEDVTNRILFTNTLMVVLQSAYTHTGEVEHLVEAARAGRAALGGVPSDGAVQAATWTVLGDVLTALGRETSDQQTLGEARRCDLKAASARGAVTTTRVRAYRRLGHDEMRIGSYEEALAAFEAAVDLVPQVAPRILSRSGRERGLVQITGLAAEVAAAAVAAGRPERAVELLEQTRGLLFGQSLDERSDLTELSGIRPDLAAEFEAVRERITALEAIDQQVPGGQLATSYSEQRRRLGGQWTQLLGRIRAVPGFAEFLRPPPISLLRRQAEDGPIVVVFASRWRAGALIVRPDPDRPVEVVPLPGLTEARVADRAGYLRFARDAADGPITGRAQAQREVHEVLAWTWDVITGPVLDHLGFTGQADPRPRIWWCPIGALAYLPLHAAGHHTDPSDRRTVLDRAVSSYVITIRALEQARNRRASAPGSAVVVAMPSTPGAPDLPGVRDETAALTRLLDSPLILTGPAATRAAVTEALARHQIAHFACHGVPDMADPGGSRLLLHDHSTRPLTVRAIAQLHLTTADLAYLSACDTTQTTESFVDEALHFTGATHLAGYRHVIGTLWPINDAAATRMATDIYRGLTAGGTRPPDTDSSARALADAVRRLRDDYPAVPTRWAGHVHFGA